jgi:hypothetical protein
MGLDMYFFVVIAARRTKALVTFYDPSKLGPRTIWQQNSKGEFEVVSDPHLGGKTWRNYYELHDYMRAVHVLKTEKKSYPEDFIAKYKFIANKMKEQFNRVPVRFNDVDLNMLEAWFRNQDPEFDVDVANNTDGKDDVPAAVYYRMYNKGVLKIARKALKEGGSCEYDSWW